MVYQEESRPRPRSQQHLNYEDHDPWVYNNSGTPLDEFKVEKTGKVYRRDSRSMIKSKHTRARARLFPHRIEFL